jgi:hypothetical protein
MEVTSTKVFTAQIMKIKEEVVAMVMDNRRVEKGNDLADILANEGRPIFPS